MYTYESEDKKCLLFTYQKGKKRFDRIYVNVIEKAVHTVLAISKCLNYV